MHMRRTRQFVAASLVNALVVPVFAQNEPLPNSRPFWDWAFEVAGTDDVEKVFEELPAAREAPPEWSVSCGRDALTGASRGCTFRSPPYLEVGQSQPGDVAAVVVDCSMRVSVSTTSRALPTRFSVPSQTGKGYEYSLRSAPQAFRDLLPLTLGGEEAAARFAMAEVGWLFTAEDSTWAGETFAFEVDGGAVFRLPLGGPDRERVDEFLSGDHCR